MLYVVRLDKKLNNGSKQTEPAVQGALPKQIDRLSEVLKASIPGREFKRIKSVSDFLLMAMAGEFRCDETGDASTGRTNNEILFAVGVPKNGYTPEWDDLIASLLDRPNLLAGTKAAVIVDGEGPMFTKDIARKLVFAANMAGCAFPGKPLVEATGDLYNFSTVAAVKGVDNMTAYLDAVSDLLDRLHKFDLDRSSKDNEKVLAIHASNKETSNSLMLLEMVKGHLLAGHSTNIDWKEIEYNEISIRNGDIVDCRGCSFDTCKHLGESGECFYGGVMVDQVYPAILECDSLILVCPNYNDAVSANMMAMFNRLTALFYNNSFADKKIYAIIVSGYSGGDIVAQQIISAMNLNKGFILPPHFAMIETANDPGSIANVSGIHDRAKAFAENIATQ